VASNTWEQPSEEQLRQIITSYLDEVVRCYQAEQRCEQRGGEFDQLERKASELLQAMMDSVKPDERRRAVLQVLCRGREHREPALPS
jgi:RNase adaptor protein for sRNA GlmZ degradation